MTERNVSFQRILWTAVGGLLLGLVVCIILLLVIQRYNEFKDRASFMRTAFVEQQKQMIKWEIDRIIERIELERTQILPNANTVVKEKVYEVCAIVENIEEKNAAIKSPEEIKRIVIEVLQPMRVYHGKGDFFILNLTGDIVPGETKSNPAETRPLQVRDWMNKQSIAGMLDVTNKDGEGNYSWSWGKDDEKEGDMLISYVKLFKPYGWIIGATISAKDMEAYAKQKLLDDIAKVRYGKNGYIFIDDWQGVVLEHGAQPELVGTNIWEHQDCNGVKVVQNLIAAAKTKEGDYVFYSWRKPDTGEERPKVSFSRGVHDWQWMVGTGVYIDDVETDIAILQSSLNASLRRDILWILMMSATVGILLLASVKWVFRRMLRDFSRFDEFFHEAAFADREIEVTGLTFRELRDMVLNANKMLQDKVAAQERLRQHRDHLEEEVAQRTHALKEKNQQLEQAKDAAEAAQQLAEKANRAKSIFLANMSHELRTPLNAVLGFSQLMRNDINITPEQKENLEIITRSGEHLLNLINNVLDISKIESGRVELEESPCDLHQIIHEIKSLLYVRAHGKGLVFTVEHPDDLPRHVAVDGGKLRQVLLNLIGNAIKFTKQGKVTLRAMKTPQGIGGRIGVRFEVEDTGAGISKEDQIRIFAPFVQLGEKAPTEAGSGLGLAISKEYVQLMSGEISVSSELGKGSVFSFEIPMTILSPETTPVAPHRGRVLGLAEEQPRYRLLIAEDQPDSRMLLLKLLEPIGFELRKAVNGQEAVDIFEQWHPHLIFMDIRMPVMDGLEATRRIKAADVDEQTKIVAVTAHALEEERREILAAGCDDFIRKPYHYLEVIEALTRNLDVQFVYENETRQFATAIQVDMKDLSSLPHALLNALEQALSHLDSDSINQAIEDIRTWNDPLAEALSSIARGLQFGRMLRMVREAQELTSPEKEGDHV